MDSVRPKHLWRRAPAITRLVCLGYVLISVGLPMLQKRMPAAPRYFLCCFHTVFELHYVWSICCSWVYRPVQDVGSLVLVFMDIFLATIYMRRKERQMGSFCFLVWILYMSTCVNLIFLALMAAFATNNPYFETLCNQGIWPILLVIITRQSLTNPSAHLTFLSVVRVQQRWYPIVFGVFLTCFSLTDLWMIVAALGFGYTETFIRVDRCYLGPAAANKLDKACFGGIISKCMCFFAKRIGNWLPAPGQEVDENDVLASTSGRRMPWTLSTRLPMAMDPEELLGELPQ